MGSTLDFYDLLALTLLLAFHIWDTCKQKMNDNTLSIGPKHPIVKLTSSRKIWLLSDCNQPFQISRQGDSWASSHLEAKWHQEGVEQQMGDPLRHQRVPRCDHCKDLEIKSGSADNIRTNYFLVTNVSWSTWAPGPIPALPLTWTILSPL